MARKYDRYGYNRQFKAKPCTKRYPFPYPLPFVDDFGVENVTEKFLSAPDTADPDTAFGGGRKRKLSRSEIEEMQRKKRATNVARKLAFEHPMSEMKKHFLTRKERRMNAAFYGATGLILTAGLAGEIPAFTAALRRTGRVIRKTRYVVERWNRRNFRGGRYHLD